MEDALREVNFELDDKICNVLILIVMEDALRAFVDAWNTHLRLNPYCYGRCSQSAIALVI